MASDLGQGDRDIPYIVVQPADADTVATLTVRKPDGSTVNVPVAGGALTVVPDSSPVEYSQRWDASSPVEYDQPAKWVLHWDIEGTGEGDEDVEVWVVASPVAGGPTWTPGRSRVAAYVPHRTLSRDLSTTAESQDVYQWTFDSTTTPTGVQADALIVDAVAWVSARVSPMHTTMTDLARAVAAILCAAWIERSWPHDDQSLQRANDMERRADAMLAGLVDANSAAGETGEYGLDIAPAWSFPPADPRWDTPDYW